MRGLNLFSSHMRQNALEAEARANLAMREQDKSDAIAVEQIAKLQRLAVEAPPIVTRPTPIALPKRAPDYPPSYFYAIGAGVVGVGLLAYLLSRRAS